jgi:hypothetical protein
MEIESFETVDDDRIRRLEKEYIMMFRLLIDIERSIDHGDIDLQQTSVAIKRLRDILGTETIMKESIKPGLVRT